MRRQGCHGIPAAAVGKTGNQNMEDARIVDLYWDRQEQAIAETQNKYGRYLLKIAWNVLADTQDSEESVNDTYLSAWKSMPPHRPSMLSTYLGKITRQISIDRLRRRTSAKRGGGQYAASLSELEEVVSTQEDITAGLEARQLADAVSRYLESIPEERRNLFLCRYFYMDSSSDMAKYTGMKEGTIRSILSRERGALKKFLAEEGFAV